MRPGSIPGRWSGTLLLLATLLASSASWATRSFSLRVRTLPPGAVVYRESRETGAIGTTPTRLRLPRGRHLLIFELAGYDPLEQPVEVSRNDTLTFTLVRSVPKATLRVVATSAEQAAGMELTINGKAEVALPSNVVVAPGNYLVAVSKAGFRPWQQWVSLGSGEERTVTVALEALPPQTGTLLVASNVVGAQVFVDDRLAGEAPALVESLTLGAHAVEVRAEGRSPQRVSALVEGGKTTRVTLSFEHVAPAKHGTLQLLSAQRGVDVYVDGEFRGKTPLTLREVAEGPHLVIAELNGHQTIEERIVVPAGQVYALRLDLRPVIAPTVVSAPAVAPPAVAATTATSPPAPAGPARAVVAAEPPPAAATARPHSDHAGVAPTLAPVPSATADESDDPRRVRSQSSYGAQLVSPRNFTADLTVGFPYWGKGRLTTGVFSRGAFGLDAGLELRSTGAFTEFDVISKFRFVNHEAVAVAALLALGAGGGPNGRNTFFLNAGVVASLIFKRVLTFSGRVYGNFYTDRHCPSSAKSGELGVCSAAGARDRDGGARLMLAGALEIPVTTNLGILAVVEGAPFQAQRKAFRDAYSSLMFESDPRIYGRLGVSFKF